MYMYECLYNAGTWEERDHSIWCKDKLTELLQQLQVPTPQGTIEVTKVKEVKGDASITFSRGKSRYLYEFDITLEWQVELESGPAKGTLQLPDMSYDCEGQYDVVITVDKLTAPAARAFIDQYIRSEREGLRPAVQDKLAQFLAEFKQK
jgi:activator of HSP90 ATPase